MWKMSKNRKKPFEANMSAVVMAALSFTIPVFVMLVSYNASGIAPLGDDPFSYMDFYHLYLPFFKEFIRNIKTGAGIFYSGNAGLGTNLYVVFATNLSSPFHFLGLIIPENNFADFFACLVVFKTGLCGLCAYLFLYYRRFSQAGDIPVLTVYRGGAALFFSVGYALCGFMMAYNWNIMWLDCVVLFPLVLWGLERLVLFCKPFLYVFTLAASIWCNYYLSIMICIFLVLYFGCLLWVGEYAKGSRRRALRDFALYSLLAGGLSAILLWPAVLALVATDFGAGQAVREGGNYFTVPGMLARHCLGVKAVPMGNHWPNIYCGAAAFLLVPLYSVSKNIPGRRRIGMLVLAGFMLFGFMNPVLDLWWHGLNYPDGLPARQSYIYSMLILMMSFECLTNWDFQEKKSAGRVVLAYLFSVGFLGLAAFLERDNGVEGTDMLLTLGFVTVYAVLLFLACRIQHNGLRGRLLFAAVTIMVLEAQINAVETNVVSSKWGKYLEPEACHTLYERAAGKEQGIFRLEMFDREGFNEGLRDDFPSASVFTSVKNSAVRAMYEKLGMRNGKVFYGFDGNTPLVAALLNVKYMLGEGDGYDSRLYPLADRENEVCLYRVSAALPFGYVAPDGYDFPENTAHAGLELQNDLVHELGIEGSLFEKCDANATEDSVTYRALEDGFYYGVVTCDDAKQVTLYGSKPGGYGWNTQHLYRDAVIWLGEMPAGAEGKIVKRNTDAGGEDEKQPEEDAKQPGRDAKQPAEDAPLAEVYRLNEEALAQAMEKLSERHLENVAFDNTHVKGELHLDKPGRLILSIPYDKSWRIRINGKEAEAATFGGALMAFDLEPGDHLLEMHYVPYGFWTGLCISVLSIVITVILWRIVSAGKQKPVLSELSNESGN